MNEQWNVVRMGIFRFKQCAIIIVNLLVIINLFINCTVFLVSLPYRVGIKIWMKIGLTVLHVTQELLTDYRYLVPLKVCKHLYNICSGQLHFRQYLLNGH